MAGSPSLAGDAVGLQDLRDNLLLARPFAVGTTDSGATTTTIPLLGVDLGDISLADGAVALDAGALGSGSKFTITTIASNTATTVTVKTALSAAPLKGFRAWVYSANDITVAIAENLKEWGGANVQAAGAASTITEAESLAGVHDPTLGTQSDAAQTDATKTAGVVAFLKGAVKVLADVWDSTLHLLHVRVTDGTNFLPTMDASTRAGYVQAASGAFVDGSLATIGAKADTAVTDPTSSGSLVALLKGLLSVGNSVQGTLTDRSGTITTGGTAQTLAAANTARRYLLVQNLDTSEDLWINFTTDAAENEPSIKLAPGQAFTFEAGFVSTEKVSVIAATAAHAWAAKEG